MTLRRRKLDLRSHGSYRELSSASRLLACHTAQISATDTGTNNLAGLLGPWSAFSPDGRPGGGGGGAGRCCTSQPSAGRPGPALLSRRRLGWDLFSLSSPPLKSRATSDNLTRNSSCEYRVPKARGGRLFTKIRRAATEKIRTFSFD